MNGRISAEKKSGPRAGTLKGEIERKIRDHDPTCAGGAKSSSRTRPPSTALDETTMAAAAIMAPGVLLKAATTVGVFLVALKRQRRSKRVHESREDGVPATTEVGQSEDPDHRPPILAGPRPCMGDLSAMETVVNLVTCVPYFRMARSVPVGVSVWNRLFSLSCTFTGVCAFLYHLSTGKIRNFFRRLDYTAVALSAVSLTCARTTEATRPLFAAALSAVLAPFQPLLVAGAHMMSTEVAFLRRALSAPKLRETHFRHTCSGLLGFAAFYGDDWFPQVPYLHAAWHVLSAHATSLTGCLVQSQVA